MDQVYYHQRYYFTGHIVHAIFCVILAIWWTVNMVKSYLESQRTKQCRVEAEPLTFRRPYFEKICIEGYFQVIGSLPYIIGNLQNTFRFGIYYHPDNLVHVLIAAPFLLSGMLDLLMARKWQFPRGLKALVVSFSFINFGLAVISHYDDVARPPLNMRYHSFVPYLCLAIVLSIHLEATHPRAHMYSFVRALLVLTLGTWLLQISFTVYPPTHRFIERADVSKSHRLPKVATEFVAHLMMNCYLIFMIGLGIGFCENHSNTTKNKCKLAGTRDRDETSLIAKIPPADLQIEA